MSQETCGGQRSEVRGQLSGLGSFPSTMQVLGTTCGVPQEVRLDGRRSSQPGSASWLFSMICKTRFGQMHAYTDSQAL